MIMIMTMIVISNMMVFPGGLFSGHREKCFFSPKWLAPRLRFGHRASRTRFRARVGAWQGISEAESRTPPKRKWVSQSVFFKTSALVISDLWELYPSRDTPPARKSMKHRKKANR